jgi:asparagine synthase (glutamine-hydrolysing)
MPLIAGALWNTSTDTTVLSQRILDCITSRTLKETQNILWYPSGIVIAGKKQGESAAEKISILENNQGIALGRIFDKKTGALYNNLSSHLHAIKRTQGKWLAEHIWGRYTIVLCDDSSITLFRDPQGLATLFTTTYKEGILFSSELAVLYEMVEEKLELDWTYLASFVGGAHHITSRTPFIGVTEVFPGYAVTISPRKSPISMPFWEPTDLLLAPRQPVDEEALIDTFSTCSAAWTQGCSTIGLELSGGIDSSSVLMMLKKVSSENQKIKCYNFFHPAIASSDEREHAKKVAQICDVELECIDLSNYLPFTLFPTEKTDKPSSFLLDHALNQEIERRAQEYDSIELMCGQGGDHLFMASPSLESPADYFLEQGIKGITPKIQDLSAYYRMPLIQVVSKTVTALARYYARRLPPIELFLEPTPWMKKAFKAKLDKTIFKVPFWEKLKSLPPAKVHHALAIYQAILYIDRGHKLPTRPIINPLLSQPLVEAALSIPTYHMYADGYDRIPFRRAMYRFQKNDYIWRKHKGETSGILILGLNARFNEVCELVIEGKFAQEHLIDKDLVYEHFQELRHGKVEGLWPLINLIAAELWFNAWKL